ncbi:MAG: DTW domain-containing protein [Nannocystaceae bacterium]|nr:DTW domain-containing protein [Nannocystaceae bacterium]
MSARSRDKPRCRDCSLTPQTCLCATLPTVVPQTRFAIVQHAREEPKPTNTGRVFAKMVQGTALVRYGMRAPAFDPGVIADPSIDWWLLFPREGAPELPVPPPVPAPGRARGIVLLDGTWHQCSRMSRRVPIVSELPCLALPPGPPSIWTVRTQHDPRGMSTFEAGLRVLSLWEGEAIAAPVREAFERITATLLHLKGKLPSAEVPEHFRTP